MTQVTQGQQSEYLLHQLDLSAARRRFETEFPTLPGKDVEAEYRKFIVLKLAHGDSNAHLLAAPKAVHDFWQQHAVDTASYLEMLDGLGVQIHFTPDTQDSSTVKAQARRLENSVDCYKARFGEDPPAAIWGNEIEVKQEPEPTGCCGQQEPIDYEKLKQAVDMSVVHTGAGDPFLTVYVKTLTNKTFEVKLNQDVTVGHLQQVFFVYSDYLPDSQRLIFNGRQLAEGHYLMRDSGVRSNDLLLVVLRLRGC